MAKRAMHLGHLYSMQPPVLVGVAPRVSPPAGQRLEVVDQAVVAALQEKQHGVPDDASAARLEDVVVLQPVPPQGLLPHEDEDLHPPGVAELEGLDVDDWCVSHEVIFFERSILYRGPVSGKPINFDFARKSTMV